MRSPVHGGLLMGLAGLFALRVLGQAVQRWLPQPWLPPFDSFQGSQLPYAVLLAAQVLLVTMMVHVAWRALRGSGAPAPAEGRFLLGFGAIYLLGSLARIAIGAVIGSAPAWFSTWIPALFHVVLATFVVVAGDHLRRRSGA